MNAHETRTFLLWCLGCNYVILLIWFSAFRFGHGWMFQLHGRWYRLSREQFDGIHYLLMGVYKIGIFLFNLVPWFVLWLAF